VRFLVWKSSSRVWAELHEQAFRRLGGAPRTVVLDYVARHIIEVLCPVPLRGQRTRSRSRAGRLER
jgi:hypothetical protein